MSYEIINPSDLDFKQDIPLIVKKLKVDNKFLKRVLCIGGSLILVGGVVTYFYFRSKKNDNERKNNDQSMV